MEIKGSYRANTMVSFSVDDGLIRSYMKKYDCNVNDAIWHLSWEGKLDCKIVDGSAVLDDTDDIVYDYSGTEDERQALEDFIYDT